MNATKFEVRSKRNCDNGRVAQEIYDSSLASTSYLNDCLGSNGYDPDEMSFNDSSCECFENDVLFEEEGMSCEYNEDSCDFQFSSENDREFEKFIRQYKSNLSGEYRENQCVDSGSNDTIDDFNQSICDLDPCAEGDSETSENSWMRQYKSDLPDVYCENQADSGEYNESIDGFDDSNCDAEPSADEDHFDETIGAGGDFESDQRKAAADKNVENAKEPQFVPYIRTDIDKSLGRTVPDLSLDGIDNDPLVFAQFMDSEIMVDDDVVKTIDSLDLDAAVPARLADCSRPLGSLVPRTLPIKRLNKLNTHVLLELEAQFNSDEFKLPTNDILPTELKEFKFNAQTRTSETKTDATDDNERYNCELVLLPSRHSVETYFQLRGSNVPSWFPGMYTFLPSDTQIRLGKSPSAIIQNSWNDLGP